MTVRHAWACVFLAAALWAQDAAPPIDSHTTFRAETRMVVLNVSVFDRQGNIVKGLSKPAFTVYENGQKQEISMFRHEDVPVSLGLIIDNSASMADKRERVNSAALALVKASNPDDEVFVMKFNEKSSLAQDFTNNVQALEKSLASAAPTGETAMRDALLLAIEHLRHGAHRDKKVLLVVTDGEDNRSVETLQHVVEAASRNDVLIYAIGLLGTEQEINASRAKKDLEQLTLATGGRAWFPSDVSEVARITPEIAHEVRNQYILGYTPSNLSADGGYRRVRVEVYVPDVMVRTRSGYYAPQA